MRRREFIILLCGAAATWPLAARAQQLPIIGVVSVRGSPTDPANFRPFLEQMRELGDVDGQNVILDRRFAAGDDSLLSGFVADLVRRPVNIIVTTGTRELVAAKQATSYVAQSKAFAEGAIKHRLPAIFAFRQQVYAGGLLAYAAKVSVLSRRAAFVVDRILKGTRAADLPIEQPTTFELVINLKTAKVLGLATLLALADEVIE